MPYMYLQPGCCDRICRQAPTVAVLWDNACLYEMFTICFRHSSFGDIYIKLPVPYLFIKGVLFNFSLVTCLMVVLFVVFRRGVCLRQTNVHLSGDYSTVKLLLGSCLWFNS